MPRDVQDLLQNSASDPTRTIDPTDVLAVAQRRARRSRTGIAVAAVVLVVGASTMLVAMSQEDPGVLEVINQPRQPDGHDDDRHDRTQAETDPSADDTVGPEPSDDGCTVPDLAPTYLPWAGSSDQVPDPDRFFQGGGAPEAGFIWERPMDREPHEHGRPDMVMISRPALDPPPPEGAPELTVRDTVGELMWFGEPEASHLQLSWREGPGRCGVVAIQLRALDAPNYLDLSADVRSDIDEDPDELRRVVEAEMQRIADSLTPVEGASFEPELPDMHWGALDGIDVRNVEVDLDLIRDLLRPEDPVEQELAPLESQRDEGWQATARTDAAWADRLSPFADQVCAWAAEVWPPTTDGFTDAIIELRGVDGPDVRPAASAIGANCGHLG